MQVKITYKGIREDGVKGIWCGFKPDNITVSEEIYILYPDENKQLRNKETGETVGSVILDDLNTENMYEEIDMPQD